MNTRSSGLKVFLYSQLVAAIVLITYTLLIWFVSQTGYLRMELAVPLVVVPLEGAAIVLSILTLQRSRREYLGAWIMLGFFRLVIGFQLPRISWIYNGSWPPHHTVITVPIIGPAEVLLSLYTLLWAVLMRHAYEKI